MSNAANNNARKPTIELVDELATLGLVAVPLAELTDLRARALNPTSREDVRREIVAAVAEAFERLKPELLAAAERRPVRRSAAAVDDIGELTAIARGLKTGRR